MGLEDVELDFSCMLVDSRFGSLMVNAINFFLDKAIF